MPLIVVSGGPCSGKTTLISEFEKRGYRVVTESAAEVIRDMLDDGFVPDADYEQLQRRIFDTQCEKEDAILSDPHAHKKLVFLDRCLIDVAAYFWVRGYSVPGDVASRLSQARYDKVYLLSLLPILAKGLPQDGVRIERDADEAFRIQALLRRAYASFQLPVIEVPIMPVDERVEFVLKDVQG